MLRLGLDGVTRLRALIYDERASLANEMLVLRRIWLILKQEKETENELSGIFCQRGPDVFG